MDAAALPGIRVMPQEAPSLVRTDAVPRDTLGGTAVGSGTGLICGVSERGSRLSACVQTRLLRSYVLCP